MSVSTEVDREPKRRWLSASALQEAPVSTGIRKIMKLYYESTSKLKDTKNKKKKHSTEVRRVQQPETARTRQERAPYGGSKQLSVTQFFTSLNPKSS